MSNLGTWIQDVANSWVMTGLTDSPLVVALLPFAQGLPIVAFSIFAGFLADSGDRRRILLTSQVIMFVVAFLLGLAVWQSHMTASYLLMLTFAIGIGMALNGPAFQTVLSDLVPPEEQQNSILVFYMGINATRVLGPAIGGVILSAFGPGAAYWLNACSYMGLMMFFWRWPLPKKEAVAEPQAYAKTLTLSDWKILFSYHNMKLWIEILAVSFCASSLWALYPSKGRADLMLNTWQFGSLLGFLGAGACVSVFFSEKLMEIGRTSFSLARSYMLYAIGLLIIGFGPSYWFMCVGMFLAGMGWLVLATLMNMSSRQQTGKSHLKATMLGVFLTVFYLGMCTGSVVWGSIAKLEGLSSAFYQSALLLALISLFKIRNEKRALR